MPPKEPSLRTPTPQKIRPFGEDLSPRTPSFPPPLRPERCHPSSSGPSSLRDADHGRRNFTSHETGRSAKTGVLKVPIPLTTVRSREPLTPKPAPPPAANRPGPETGKLKLNGSAARDGARQPLSTRQTEAEGCWGHLKNPGGEKAGGKETVGEGPAARGLLRPAQKGPCPSRPSPTRTPPSLAYGCRATKTVDPGPSADPKER